jgi:putative (di)nucleoside polyphosphate hydrolase
MGKAPPPSVTGLPYRRGVGAVLFNRAGLVFVGRRIDTPGEAWQLPQGGIDADERPQTAVLRELAEEIGSGDAEIIARTPWLAYDFPADLVPMIWHGRYRGQKQRWYALRFRGSDADIRLDATPHPEFDAWRWVPIETLPALAVAFKEPLYRRLVAAFAPLAPAIAADLSGPATDAAGLARASPVDPGPARR